MARDIAGIGSGTVGPFRNVSPSMKRALNRVDEHYAGRMVKRMNDVQQAQAKLKKNPKSRNTMIALRQKVGGLPQLGRGVTNGAKGDFTEEQVENYRKKNYGVDSKGAKVEHKNDGDYIKASLGFGGPVKAVTERLITKYLATHPEIDGRRNISKREMARIKVQAMKRVYHSEFHNCPQYRPDLMTLEIREVLAVDKSVPNGIDTQKGAEKQLAAELNRYVWPKGEDNPAVYQTLDPSLRPEVERWLLETLDLYLKTYPDKKPEEGFVFVREMIRAMAYQQIFDHRDLSGSDHGWLHATNNIKNSERLTESAEKIRKGKVEQRKEHDHTHDETTVEHRRAHAHAVHHHDHVHGSDLVDESKLPPKLRLMLRVSHCYHDIGYAVPDPHWAFTKDHPFVGAGFIDANREFFDKYLGDQMRMVLRDTILTHAIVQFDFNALNKVGEDMTTQEFREVLGSLMSTSDGCAAGRSDKMQNIWRRNPEAMRGLAQVSSFVKMAPMYGKKFASNDIVKDPSRVFELKDPSLTGEARFAKENFKRERDYFAHKAFSEAVQQIKGTVLKNAPKHLRADFEGAIDNKLNLIGLNIVIKQFGMELVDLQLVEAPKELQEQGVLFLPKVRVAMTRSGNVLGDSNLFKLAEDEFGLNKDEILKALTTGEDTTIKNDHVVFEMTREVPEPDTAEAKKAFQVIEDELKVAHDNACPMAIRKPLMGVWSAVADIRDVLKDQGKIEAKLKQLDQPGPKKETPVEKGETSVKDLIAQFSEDEEEQTAGLTVDEKRARLQGELEDLGKKLKKLNARMLEARQDLVAAAGGDKNFIELAKAVEEDLGPLTEAIVKDSTAVKADHVDDIFWKICVLASTEDEWTRKGIEARPRV